jgi:hypothetical protein
MKKTVIAVMMVMAATAFAAPVRVALLDFDDQTGMRPDEQLGGAIQPGALADKGVYLLAKELLGVPEFVLIDRREFIEQVEQLQPRDMGRETPTKPTFIQAAQALNADAVLRGSLLSFSTGGQSVNQGGHQADFTTLSLRVAVEALDPVSGTVIAMADGSAQSKFRQTASLQTTLSEDDVLDLFSEALDDAVPELKEALSARAEAKAARPTVSVSIKTSADPALVEIDGMLVGTTPVEGLKVYEGDHVLTIGKPGYQDVTKRIMFKNAVAIEVPMIRTQLTAEEMKDVLEKMRMNVIVGEPGIVIHEITD